jgi:hypothetical protein
MLKESLPKFRWCESMTSLSKQTQIVLAARNYVQNLQCEACLANSSAVLMGSTWEWPVDCECASTNLRLDTSTVGSSLQKVLV